MLSFLKQSIALTSLLVSAHAFAEYAGPRVQSYDNYTTEFNQKLYSQYCIDRGIEKPPEPRYQNSEVWSAAQKLSDVREAHFYFYSGVRKRYLGTIQDSYKVQAPNGEATMNGMAHAFLVQLCGEFRDRASMVEAKIRWINRMNKLPVAHAQANPDGTYLNHTRIKAGESLWQQVNAYWYTPYIQFSSQLHYEKQMAAYNQGPLSIGGYSIDPEIPGATVCETKYVFDRYIGPQRNFTSLDDFRAGYASYANEYCLDGDEDYYYDFRGDSNFKHNTPEANGMIWHVGSIAGQCDSFTTAKDGSLLSDESCENYFRAPFAGRWNAARNGLSTWLFRTDKEEINSVFQSEGASVVILPEFKGEKKPFNFSFAFGGEVLSEWLDIWNAKFANYYSQASIGFNAITGLGTNNTNWNLAYERLRDAVNRHTDWYASAYDDGMGGQKNQAYSPFVASSFEMSASDAFVQCGYTVQCPDDGHKRWMYVFLVPVASRYTSNQLAQNQPIDIDHAWFDETSLGTNSLAKSEKAFDRLGTALEREYDSILYLDNIGSDGRIIE